MGVKIGNLDVIFKVGNADCKVYLGDTLLYPTTPPVFEGKYKLTLSDSSTVSAECDVTSAVTSGEVASQYSGSVVSAEIGNCCNTIGDYAFRNCSGLTSIDIPDSVTSIGAETFRGCSSLTSIDIPSGVTSIGGHVFQNCTSLTSIEIPSGVTSISNSAFNGCRSLTSIDIPDSVTSISTSAFTGCYSLTTCTIGSGVTSIGANVFRNCSGLTSITVEATTPATLGPNAFNNTNDCPIYVPCDSVNTFKSASVWSNYASRIQAISGTCFDGKWKATYTGGTTSSAECDSTSAITYNEINASSISVELGDCVTSIGSMAFFYHPNLSSVTISNSVTSIGDEAFMVCGSLTSIDIPNSVTSIGDEVFQDCSSLSSCTIGSGVTSIGDNAFNSCTGLTGITVNATVPPTLGSGAFDDTNDCPIYVPAASLTVYQTATGWSDYSSRLQAIS